MVPQIARPRRFENTPVIHRWHAVRFVRQHRLDGSPFVAGEFVAHHWAHFSQGLESRLGGKAQQTRATGALVAMRRCELAAGRKHVTPKNLDRLDQIVGRRRDKDQAACGHD